MSRGWVAGLSCGVCKEVNPVRAKVWYIPLEHYLLGVIESQGVSVVAYIAVW